jgi:hypothetical protein
MPDYQQVANALAEADANLDRDREETEGVTFVGVLSDIVDFFEREDPFFRAKAFKDAVKHKSIRLQRENEAKKKAMDDMFAKMDAVFKD